jgi:hypothetical protein
MTYGSGCRAAPDTPRANVRRGTISRCSPCRICTSTANPEPGRFKSGTTELSAHAKGIAIDINPVQNPFVNRSGKVFPKEGSKYDEERSGRRTSWGPSSTETSS